MENQHDRITEAAINHLETALNTGEKIRFKAVESGKIRAYAQNLGVFYAHRTVINRQLKNRENNEKFISLRFMQKHHGDKFQVAGINFRVKNEILEMWI